MLVGESFGDPDNCNRIQAGGVGHQLAQMCVVCLLKLILDKDESSIRSVLAENVRAVRTNFLLLGHNLKVESQRIGQ